MADYQPYPSMATRRSQQRGSSDEDMARSRTIRPDLEPAPQPWPWMPYVAVLLMCGFLALQLYPSTHWRHPQDRLKRWVKHGDPQIVLATGRDDFYSSLDEVQVQQAEDLAAQQAQAALAKVSFECPKLNSKFESLFCSPINMRAWKYSQEDFKDLVSSFLFLHYHICT